jgi:hypothetical protein
MKLLRAFLFLLVVSTGLGAGGVVWTQVAAAEPVAMVQSAPAEDAETQSRAFAEAYNLLLDHYVRPLDIAAMLRAGWDNLAKEADSKAAAPGPSPEFTGDRASDLEAMREGLSGYLAKPNSSPDGFTAACNPATAS